MNRKRGRSNVGTRGGGRPRGGAPVEKTLPLEGVYANHRFTHVVSSLVGNNVQLQVKNGKIYEGILKTLSPKMDVVLEMAHMVEDPGNNNQNSVSPMPSRERLMDKLIVRLGDIVVVNAINVELDYAVKDTFTDSAISGKVNGEIKEKEMKELQPWDSEGADEVGGLHDGDASNGWDPNEMFRTNAMQFNVKSSYDDSLSQYTTQLDKRDTEEFKKREQVASQLAAEIEGSEQYRRRIELENGEGEEEEKFSAVQRTNEVNSQSLQGAGSNTGKYVPPARRTQGMGKPRGGGVIHGHSARVPPNQSSAPPPHQHPSQYQTPPQHPPPRVPPPNVAPPDLSRVNGEDRNSESVSSVSSMSSSSSSPHTKASPVPEQVPVASPTDSSSRNESPSQNNMSPPSNKLKGGHRKEKDKQQIVDELKQFSSNFKLTEDSKEKEREKERTVEKDNSVNRDKETSGRDVIPQERTENCEPVQVEECRVQETPPSPSESHEEHYEPAKKSVEESSLVKNSNLNPNAKEFVMSPKAPSFTPKQQTQQQNPTPPRPQTQSPIIQQIPMQIQPQPQPVYPGPGQQYTIMHPGVLPMMASQPPVAAQQQTQYKPAKRAVVSVHPQRPDYTAAAAQAATGQPLLAQATPPQQYVYSVMPGVPPQPTGYTMGQVMPMPSTTPSGPRFVNPTPTSMPMVPTTSLQGAPEHGTQTHTGSGGPVFMATPPTQQMQAHMPQGHLAHPNHIAHHPGNPPQNQQNTQITPQTAGHHPAPSPVHNTGPNPHQPHNQGHPPSSGTPQPHQGYPQGVLGHPPLQPSPHNPTSPQNMQSIPYQYTSHAQHQAAASQFTMNQSQQVPTSVTYSTVMQTHGHSPHMPQPQIVMMPPPGSQMQHNPSMHNTQQFQGHPHMGVPASVQSQAALATAAAHLMQSQAAGVQGMPGANHSQGHPQQLHQFVPPGLTAAALNVMHARQADHLLVPNLRK